MKIKNYQIIQTVQAINNMPALQKSPKATFALAKNHNKLKNLNEDFEEAKKKIWAVHFAGELEAKRDDIRLKKYYKDEEVLLNIEIDFTPHCFSIKDLDMELNNISPLVLSVISWLIKDFNEE